MVTLSVEKKDDKISVNKLRRAGKIPAVYYGRKQPSTPVTIVARDFLQVFKQAGESTVVTLQTPEGPLEALIYDIDRDPITGAIRHADFYVFEKGQKIKIKIPLEFTGVAPAVKEMGGVLVKVLHEVEVEAAPKDLPHRIPVDISTLVNFQSQVTAKQIILPVGVVLVTGAEEVVVSVYEPKEEVEEVVAAPDLSAIEVEKKGKEVKEGEEGEAAAGGETVAKIAPKAAGKEAPSAKPAKK